MLCLLWVQVILYNLETFQGSSSGYDDVLYFIVFFLSPAGYYQLQ